MNKGILSLLLLITVAVSGCSSSSLGVRSDYSFDSHPDSGLYAVATRWDLQCDLGMLPVTVDTSTHPDMSHTLLLSNAVVPNDFDDPAGFFYVREGKPGTYAFKYMHLSNGHFRRTLHFDKPLTFSIEKAKLAYLGEVTIRVENCREEPIDGEGSPEIWTADTDISIADKWERDSKLAAERLERLDSMPVVKKLMKQ